MNSIKRLYEISLKEERLILGLMSGTSLDGLDLALCKFIGSGLETKVELKFFETISYDSSFKRRIKEVFAKETVSLETVCLLNEEVALKHAEIINSCLKKWEVLNENVDLVASHGQTIYHAPKIKHKREFSPDGTMQIGDGDHIAVKTGIITISDFRQKNIAAGGEGAPLAVYGDYLLFFSDIKDRFLLNIGGISNFTYLPSDSNGKIFCTDCGPGNTIIDNYMLREFGLHYDEDAVLSSKGNINKELLDRLLLFPFYKESIPKSTGPEIFNLNYLDDAIADCNVAIKHEDVLATLCELTAVSIAGAIKSLIDNNQAYSAEIFVSGGGLHNPLIMYRLKMHLPMLEFRNTVDLGVLPDAKEAILFGLLANETISGKGFSMNAGNKFPQVCMGKISLPN